MKIVVTKRVTMFVEKFVSYMKHEGQYSLPALIRNKKNMLQHLRGFINQVVVANDNKTSKRYYCSWRDGQTPMTWIFYFIVLPQQDMTVIYGLTSKRSVEMPDRQIREDKDVKKILSLMESMGQKIPTKKVGEYTAIDGQWWDGLPHGLEHKGLVQDVRMYDNNKYKGCENFETYALFRRCDNKNFFYAKISLISGTNETK